MLFFDWSQTVPVEMDVSLRNSIRVEQIRVLQELFAASQLNIFDFERSVPSFLLKTGIYQIFNNTLVTIN